MKILAINGSPRKGNTLSVIKEVSKVLEDLGDVEIDFIHLSDINLQTCKGCFQCIQRGSENCPLKDDRDMLIEKIMDADGVIFASPVYVMHVTSIFKNMVDRFAFICHRPRFFQKPAMIISTTAAWGLKETMKYMTNITKVWGFSITSELGLITPPYKFSMDKFQKKIKSESLKFYNAVRHKDEIRPDTNQVIQFYMQKKIFGNPKLKEIMPRDYKFFQDEVGENFFTDKMKAGIGQKVIARLISMMVKI